MKKLNQPKKLSVVLCALMFMVIHSQNLFAQEKKSDNTVKKPLLKTFKKSFKKEVKKGVEKNNHKRPLSFSWPKIKGSIGYQIEFTKKVKGDYKSKLPIIRVTEPTWSGELLPGRYRFKLQSLDSRGVPGAWSKPSEMTVRHKPVQILEPEVDQKIPSKDDEEQQIKIAWEFAPNTAFYKVKIFDKAGKNLITEVESKIATAQVKLDVAKEYSVKVIAVSHDDDDGDMEKAGQPFSILGKRLAKPKIEIAAKDIEDEAEWSKPEFSDHFYLEVLFKSDKPKKNGKKKSKKTKWKKILDKDFYKENTYKPERKGKYKLRITAKGKHRQPSKKLVYKFTYPAKTKKELLDLIDIEIDFSNRSGSFTYSYIPSLQIFSLASESVTTNLSIIFANSHRLSTEYWFGRKTFGLELSIQRQSMTLFEDQSDSVSNEQQPLPLTYWFNDLMLAYRIHFGGIKIDLDSGIYSKTLYIFRQESVESLNATETTIIEVPFGAKIHYMWTTNDIGFAMKSFSAVSANPMVLVSGTHSNYDLFYSSYNDKGSFKTTYTLYSDFAEYQLKESEDAELQTISTTSVRASFAFSWLY